MVSCKPDRPPEGSLFNHSDNPNTSYSIDTSADSIHYTTVRHIESGEELCIFHGDHLWFTPAGSSSIPPNPFSEGNPNQIIPEDELPFIRVKPLPQEEEMETIQTGINISGQSILPCYSKILVVVPAWVVDIPDQRQIANVLKYDVISTYTA